MTLKMTTTEFDILNWWKLKTSEYYILSYMARDILAILAYIPSSESAFNTRDRILDLFHSSLSPTTIEFLICAQNWLRSTKQNVNDLQVEINEAEKIEFGV